MVSLFLIAMATTVNLTQYCFKMPFPILLSGTSGPITFRSMDTSMVNADIAIGGDTGDKNIETNLSQSTGKWSPIIAAYNGASYMQRWMKTFYSEGSTVQSIQYSTSGQSILAVIFQWSDLTATSQLLLLHYYDGSLLGAAQYNSGGYQLTLNSRSTIIDSSNNVYILNNQVNTGKSQQIVQMQFSTSHHYNANWAISTSQALNGIIFGETTQYIYVASNDGSSSYITRMDNSSSVDWTWQTNFIYEYNVQLAQTILISNNTGVLVQAHASNDSSLNQIRLRYLLIDLSKQPASPTEYIFSYATTSLCTIHSLYIQPNTTIIQLLVSDPISQVLFLATYNFSVSPVIQTYTKTTVDTSLFPLNIGRIHYLYDFNVYSTFFTSGQYYNNVYTTNYGTGAVITSYIDSYCSGSNVKQSSYSSTSSIKDVTTIYTSQQADQTIWNLNIAVSFQNISQTLGNVTHAQLYDFTQVCTQPSLDISTNQNNDTLEFIGQTLIQSITLFNATDSSGLTCPDTPSFTYTTTSSLQPNLKFNTSGQFVQTSNSKNYANFVVSVIGTLPTGQSNSVDITIILSGNSGPPVFSQGIQQSIVAQVGTQGPYSLPHITDPDGDGIIATASFDPIISSFCSFSGNSNTNITQVTWSSKIPSSMAGQGFQVNITLTDTNKYPLSSQYSFTFVVQLQDCYLNNTLPLFQAGSIGPIYINALDANATHIVTAGSSNDNQLAFSQAFSTEFPVIAQYDATYNSLVWMKYISQAYNQTGSYISISSDGSSIVVHSEVVGLATNKCKDTIFSFMYRDLFAKLI